MEILLQYGDGPAISIIKHQIAYEIYFYIFLYLFLSRCLFAQVGIGTSTPPAGALLEVRATSKGILLPRLTGADIENLKVDENSAGLICYDLDRKYLVLWNGSSWRIIKGSPVRKNQAGGLSTSGAGVAISASGPHNSALLDIGGSDGRKGGLLLPRLSSTQRNLISPLQAGMLIFNTTTTTLNFCVGSSWINLADVPADYEVKGTATTNGKNIGIGTDRPNEVAYLDLNSTSKALLLPRMNSAQVSAINSPAPGLILSQAQGTLTERLLVYTGNNFWLDLTFSCGDWVDFEYGSFATIERYGSIRSSTNNNCWLDRNLGAQNVATGPEDFTGFGDLYQWGRRSDGHERVSWISTFDADLSRTTRWKLFQFDSPSWGWGEFVIDELGFTSEPTWLLVDRDDLWQGMAGLNNPCPPGWRIPTIEEWMSAGESVLNTVPTVPGRSAWDGSLDQNQTAGNYWTSTVGGSSSSLTAWVWFSQVTTWSKPRGTGAAVRCIF